MLRNRENQKRIPEKCQLSEFVCTLKPFLHFGGALRWVTLLVLSPLAAELNNLQLIELQIEDLEYVGKFLTGSVYPSEVLHVLQGLLLLPENRRLLRASSVVENYLCTNTKDDIRKAEITELLCNFDWNKQETNAANSGLISHDVHQGDFIERLLSVLRQFKSSMASGEDVHDIASTSALLLKQLKEKIENRQADISTVYPLATLLAYFIIDFLSGKLSILFVHAAVIHLLCV